MPTQANTTIVFSGTSYDENIIGLASSTTYYFRPFFVNQDGVFFGNQLTITTLSTSIIFSNITESPSITTVDISGNYSFQQGQGVNVISKGAIVDGTEYQDTESVEGNISLTSIGAFQPDTPHTYALFVTTEFGTSQSETIGFYSADPSSIISDITITNINFTGADFSATYENSYSGSDITSSKGFLVSINEDFDNSQSFTSSSSDGTIDASVSTLIPNATYYVKAFVENEYGTNYSNQTAFETNDAGYNFNAIIITEIDFEQSNAAVSFTESEFSFVAPISKGFRISTNSSFEGGYVDYIDDNNVETGTEIASLIDNLDLYTTYFIKAFVQNEYGLFFSDISSFQTLDLQYTYSYTVNSFGYDNANISVQFNQAIGAPVEIIEKGIEIYDNSSYNVVDNDSQDGQINLDLPNLQHNTNYLFTAYVLTEYGKIYFYDGVGVNTLNATPVISSTTENVSFNSLNILTNTNYAPSTENSLIRIIIDTPNFPIYLTLDNNESVQNTIVENLQTNTNYTYTIEVTNQYGTFTSLTYQFATLNDEPTIDFSYELTAENQITLTGAITPAVNDESISSIYIQYKHHEESNYTIINLSSSNYSISEVLNDLVQGPNYNFKLVIVNDYNTFEENLYYNIPVTYEVGDYLFGGVIAYIDPTGYHGYIMSELEYVANLQWSTDRFSSDELAYLSNLNTYDDGVENTQIIIDFHLGISDSAPAAEYCASLNINGYDDWYLGSDEEYSIAHGPLWYQLIVLNGAPHNVIWTSNTIQYNSYPDLLYWARINQYNGNSASVHQFKDTELSVWPIRKF